MKTDFNKGDLVLVKMPFDNDERDDDDLCIITEITIPCVIKVNEFFMVYNITTKQKFITVKKFMTKVS